MTTSKPYVPKYVFIKRPRCPWCQSTRHQRQRTDGSAGDGSITRHMRCKTCGKLFRLVID